MHSFIKRLRPEQSQINKPARKTNAQGRRRKDEKVPLWKGLLVALLPGLMLLTYFSFYPVSATSISDVDNQEVIVDLLVMNFDSDRHSNPCPDGYDWDGTDMNEGARGKSIYLCYKKGHYPLSEAITNVTVVSDNDSHPDCPSGYTRITRAAPGSDNTGFGSGDLNDGAGGSFIYICYKKQGTGAPLLDINVRKKNGGDFQCRYEIGGSWDGAGTNGPLGTETDLNAGVTPPGELHDYIHLCYKDLSSLFDDLVVDWCGGDEEQICRPGSDFAVLNGNGGCDRGLEQDGTNIDSSTCDNGRGEQARRQDTARNFQDTWNYWALRNQRQQLNWNVPISKVMMLGAHNAFNNKADGYISPNQEFSITDVLRAGMRVIDLDVHQSVEPQRIVLCHGICSATDRFYYNAVKEIRDWMLKDENKNEVIIISLEDYLDDDDADEVNIPLRVFLDRPDIGVFTPADYDAQGGFQSQSWMVAHQKRVIVLAQDRGYDNLYVFQKTADNRQVSYRRDGKNNWYYSDIDNCSINGKDTLGIDIPVDPEGTLFSEVYESRIPAENEFKGLRQIDRGDLAGLAKCNIKLINLDKVLQEDRDRFKGAVWSWTEDDWGDKGDAAMMSGSTGRWVSTDESEQKPFACRTDVKDAHPIWNVTNKAGRWVEGWSTCQAEYPGSEFAVPVNGWENEKLKVANLQHADLWLNYNDILEEGNWMINKPPAISITGPATVDEGRALPLGESFLVEINDEDPRNLALDGLSCGDNGVLTMEEHGLILPGSTTATINAFCKFPEGPATSVVSLKATDSLGISSTAAFNVIINNVAPKMTAQPSLSASLINENGSVTLSGAFDDPGVLDPHVVTIDWRDGNSSTINLQPETNTFSIVHQYLDDDPTATSSDTQAISVRVDDDDGGTDSGGATLIVNNVAPVALMSVSGTAPLGGGLPVVPNYASITAAGSFTDVGTKDTHRAAINWGDASTPSDAFSASHYYVAPGTYTITLTVTDDDGGVGTTASQLKVVTALSALSIASDTLLQLLNRTDLDRSSRDAIGGALDELRGNAGGRAGNGASDQLSKGNTNAALDKIKKALLGLGNVKSTDSTLAGVRLLLAQTAKSVAVEAIVKAEAGSPRQNVLQKIREAKALVAAGDTLLQSGAFWGAADKYQAAARLL